MKAMSFRRIGKSVFSVGLALGLLAMGSGAQSQPLCKVTVSPGESIQQAIDAAPSDAVICLVAGRWEENLVIGKSLTLRGEGKEPKEVQIVGVKKGHPVIRIESEREIEVVIENLTAAEAKGDRCAVRYPQWICPNGLQALGKAKVIIKDVQVSGNGGAGLDVWGSATVSLTNSTVSNNRGDGLRVGGFARVNLTNSTVSNNEESGLGVGGLATVSLTGSTVSGNGWYGLRVWGSERVSLTNSTVSGNEDDGLSVGDSATVEIKESIVNDNKHCGIYVYSSEAQVHGTPNTMRGNGADLCGFAPASLRKPLVPPDPRSTLAVPADYPTVQQAIDAIVPGGTIEIAAGSYEEGLTIWKPVVLRGAGQDRTVLQALPERGLVLSIIVEVRGVRIEELKVMGSQGTGLLFYGREITIQEAQVSGNWVGLIVWGSATVSLTNSTVFNNEKHGLIVGGSARMSLTDSQVSDNKGDGLIVGDSARVNLSNSTVFNNEWHGLAVWGSATVSLTNSQVSGNRDDGLWVWGSATVSLTNSTVSGNGGDGLDVWDSATVSLTNSTVSDNEGDGLDMEYSAKATVRESEISGNKGNGIFLKEKAVAEIWRNHILNNEGYGVALYWEGCVDDYNDWAKFVGQVIGESNIIPGKDAADGNKQGDLCPADYPWPPGFRKP